MGINEEYNTKSNGIPGQIDEKNSISTLLEEMEITFPDEISHAVYHNAIQNYYESLNKILSQFP